MRRKKQEPHQSGEQLHTVSTIGKLLGAENWQVRQLRQSLEQANPDRPLGRKVGRQLMFSNEDVKVFQSNRTRIRPRMEPQGFGATSVVVVVVPESANAEAVRQAVESAFSSRAQQDIDDGEGVPHVAD